MPIKFTSRKNIFEQNPVLASHIYHWQRATYNPAHNLYEVGEKVVLNINDEDAVTLTAAQAEELNRDYEEYCAKLCDDFVSAPQEVPICDRLIAEWPCRDINVFIEKIGPQIQALGQSMNWRSLLVISDVKNPYLEQKNDFSPAKQARETLGEMGLSNDYHGGINLSDAAIAEFFSAIFWIVRCNACAPYILFSAPNSAIVGTLCKYGNIHFECYEGCKLNKFKNALTMAGFEIPDDGLCREHFSSSSAIDGRRLQID